MRGHHQRAIVVQDHALEPESVERGALRVGKGGHVGGGHHPHRVVIHVAVVHLAVDGLGAPLLEPRVHVRDLGGLRGLDARREILHRRTRLARRIEGKISHLHGLLMVRDHLLREHHVGLTTRAHLTGIVGRALVVMPHAAVQRVATATGGDGGHDHQGQQRGEQTDAAGHALSLPAGT